MLVQTRGIVLNTIKYGDSGIIVKILTEDLGLVSFMTRRSKGRKSSVSSRNYFKLAILDLVFSHKANKDLQYIKESGLHYHYQSVQTNIQKSTILMFLNEILYRTIREEETNKPLFDFLYQSLVSFDTLDQGVSNFHLYFMLQFSRFLGILPQDNYSESNKFFSLPEAKFLDKEEKEPYDVSADLSKILNTLMNSTIEEIRNIQMNTDNRRKLLLRLIEYYKIHHDNSLQLKSHKVLEQVFS